MQPHAPLRIAVGVEDTPAGHDAVALGAMLARAAVTDDLMLVGIHVEPLGWDEFEADTRDAARRAGEALGAQARIVVEADSSEWRGLRTVARREHRDLLVVGSGHRAHPGRVHLGRDMRDLLERLDCALVVAPSGFRDRRPQRLRRVGVGFDDRPESRGALTLAARLAAGADAELVVSGVMDGQVLDAVGEAEIRGALEGGFTDSPEVLRLKVAARVADDAESLAREAGAAATVGVERRPMAAPSLLELSDEVDVLVVGSSRRGPHGRVEPGRTAGALLRGARCPLVLTPRRQPPV